MSVENLQSWADNLEIVRLPAIETDIANLQSGLTAADALLTDQGQQFQDTLDQHSIRIDVAQEDADAAEARALAAQQGIGQNYTDAQGYTDAQLAAIQANLQANIEAERAYVDGAYWDSIQLSVSNSLAADQTTLQDKVDEAKSYRDELATSLSDFDTTSGQILTDTLPVIQALQDQIEIDVTTLQADMSGLTAGMVYNSIQEGLDDYRAQAESALVPMQAGALRPPVSLWTRDTQTPSNTADKPGISGWGTFIEDDPDLGRCFEFPAGVSESIGPSHAVAFQAGRVYKIEVTFKVVSGTPGSSIKVSLHNGLSLQDNANRGHGSHGTADGVVNKSIYVSTDFSKLQNYGLLSNELLVVSGSADSNLLYYGFHQYSGQIRLSHIEIKDVTDILDSFNLVRDELDSIYNGSNAAFRETYYTIADIGFSGAGGSTTVKSMIEDPYGSSIGATLATEYYTISQADTAIASEISQLRATIEDENGNSVGAELSDLSETVATKDSFSSRKLLAATAGSSSASLEILAFDSNGNEDTGASLSQIKLSAQNILLDASVKANHIDTRGLDIRDDYGSIVFKASGVGAGIDASLVNNLNSSLNLGAFADIDRITDFNADVYIEDGAIQNAHIAELDAGKITTGILDAGRIDTRGLSIKDNAGNIIFQASGVSPGVNLANVIGAGPFAGVGEINSGNIHNFFANAAIGDAYIGDLSANKITTGQLDAARINTTGLTIRDSNGNILLDASGSGSIDLDRVAGAGDFAGVSQINSGNVATLLSTAAIGEAYIGTLSAGKIKLGGVHLESDYSGNLVIKEGAVSTPFIGNRAVMEPVLAFTSASLSLRSYWRLAQIETYSRPRSDPTIIIAKVSLAMIGTWSGISTDHAIDIRITYNYDQLGSIITVIPNSTYHTETIVLPYANTTYMPINQNNNLSVYVKRASTNNGQSQNVANRFLYVLGDKK